MMQPGVVLMAFMRRSQAAASSAFVFLTRICVRASDACSAFFLFFVDVSAGEEQYNCYRQYRNNSCYIHYCPPFFITVHGTIAVPCTILTGIYCVWNLCDLYAAAPCAPFLCSSYCSSKCALTFLPIMTIATTKHIIAMSPGTNPAAR